MLTIQVGLTARPPPGGGPPVRPSSILPLPGVGRGGAPGGCQDPHRRGGPLQERGGAAHGGNWGGRSFSWGGNHGAPSEPGSAPHRRGTGGAGVLLRRLRPGDGLPWVGTPRLDQGGGGGAGPGSGVRTSGTRNLLVGGLAWLAGGNLEAFPPGAGGGPGGGDHDAGGGTTPPGDQPVALRTRSRWRGRFWAPTAGGAGGLPGAPGPGQRAGPGRAPDPADGGGRLRSPPWWSRSAPLLQEDDFRRVAPGAPPSLRRTWKGVPSSRGPS